MVECPLCKSPHLTAYAQARDIEYLTSEQVYTFHRCSACDVLVIDPMLADGLSLIYPPNYYSFRTQDKPSLAQRVKTWLDRRAFSSLLSTIEGEDISVLDVGGGTGWLLDVVKSCDPRVTRGSVIDIDADAEATARASGHGYFRGRFEEYSGADTFDLILMLNLIEHVADPRAVLRKAHALLSSRGRLLIKTPNFDSLDARVFRHRSWAGYHTPRHFVLFTRDSLLDECRRCGLDVVSFDYTQGAPFWSASILNVLKEAGLASVTKDRPAIYHPLMPSLQIASAAFDFIRKPFSKLSQMQLVLKKRADA